MFAKSKIGRKYGWKPSISNHFAPKYADHVEITCAAALPSLIDLRPYCPPVYNQSSLGSCHDDITEILTSEGWKLFSNITLNDELASVNPKTKELIFEKPTRIVRFDYDGDMYYGKHLSMDFAVTPDHKMLVRKWNQKEITLGESFELIEMKNVGWYAGLMNSVTYEGINKDDIYVLKDVEHKHKPQRSDKNIPMNLWMKLLGIYLAEGTLIKPTRKKEDKTKFNNHYKIQLAAFKEREKNYIRQLLDDLDINYCELTDRFTFDNKQIYTAFSEYGLKSVKASFKFVPKFVFGLKPEHIKAMLEGHFMGDGWEDDGFISHGISSIQLANDIQALILLTGKWSSIYKREPRTSVIEGREIKGNFPEYVVGTCNNRNFSIDKKANISIEHYKGEVFCAEVPTYHTLVTRRNNKILISGNCTANAGAGLAEFLIMKEEKPAFVPSRLFIYYNERVLEGTVNEDSGASLSDSIQVLQKNGAPPESMWWYDIAKFTVKPNQATYKVGLLNTVSNVYNIDNSNLTEMKSCIASAYASIIGFTIYESFESQEVATTGMVPMPSPGEQILGGHAVMIVGFDDTKQCFIVRNSWGASWGLNGYFYMPYAYFTNLNLASDCWTAHTIA